MLANKNLFCMTALLMLMAKFTMGTALNKILKDIIIKYKYLQGFDTPYVPGWDTHGMPIEHAAIKNLGLNRHELGHSCFA